MPDVNKSEAIRDYFKSNPKAKNSEVVYALAKRGVMVNANFVSTIKMAHNKAQAAKKAAKSQATITDKKPEVSKLQAARDYLKANKKARNSEVVEALGKQGITITPNYVSNIKAKHKMRRKVVKTAVATGSIGIPEIKAALAFIKSIGSVTAAKQALAVAEEIRKIV